NLLGEVRLERIGAEVRLIGELGAVPRRRRRIREVDDRAEPHTALGALTPDDRVINAAVWPAKEVAVRRALPVERALQRDVGVDPQTIVEPFAMELGQEALWIGEAGRVPLEVAPHVGALPERVQMEDVAGDALGAQAARHLEHRGFGELDEARRGPQAERPLRRHRRATGQLRVGGHDLLRRAGHQVVVELVALGLEGVSAIRSAAEMKADGGRDVDEDPVAAAADDDREILVGQLRARAVRVPVPDANGPAHQIEPAEPLAAPVEVILGIEQQRLDDTADAPRRVVRQALDLEPGARAEALPGEVGVVVNLMGQEPAVACPVGELPGIETRLDDDVPCAQRDAIRGAVDRPRSGIGPADDVAESLRGGDGTRCRPHADDTRRDGAQRDTRRRHRLGHALELDARRGSFPPERPDDTEVASLQVDYPLTAPSERPLTRYRCRASVMMMLGSITITAAALISP